MNCSAVAIRRATFWLFRFRKNAFAGWERRRSIRSLPTLTTWRSTRSRRRAPCEPRQPGKADAENHIPRLFGYRDAEEPCFRSRLFPGSRSTAGEIGGVFGKTRQVRRGASTRPLACRGAINGARLPTVQVSLLARGEARALQIARVHTRNPPRRRLLGVSPRFCRRTFTEMASGTGDAPARAI